MSDVDNNHRVAFIEYALFKVSTNRCIDGEHATSRTDANSIDIVFFVNSGKRPSIPSSTTLLTSVTDTEIGLRCASMVVHFDAYLLCSMLRRFLAGPRFER